MTPEQVLDQKPRVLTQKQRESYFEKGYLLVEKAVPMDWIEQIRAVTDEAVRRGSEIIVMGGPRRVRLASGKRAIFGDTVDFVLKHAPVRVMVAAGGAAE